MSVLFEQEVQEVRLVADAHQADRNSTRRRVVAGPAGLALLLAGGGLLIRVALLAFHEDDMTGRGWLFTAVACLLAGVALVLIALPRVVTTGSDKDGKSDVPGGQAPE